MKLRIEWWLAFLWLSCSSDPAAEDNGSAGGGQNGNAGASGLAGSQAGNSPSAAGAAGTEDSGGSPGASSGASGGAGGGSAGKGETGAAGNAGSSSDDCPATFCDDFESYPPNIPPQPVGTLWAFDRNDAGQLRIMTGNAHSGEYALRITTTGVGGNQRAFASLSAASLSGAPLFTSLARYRMWGRFWFYSEALANQGVPWTMIQGEGRVSGDSYDRYVRYGGQGALLAANYATSSGDLCTPPPSQSMMPQGVWTCVEWLFDGDTPDTMNLYIDGVAVDDLAFSGPHESCTLAPAVGWNFPPFSKVLIGWESYDLDDPREIWIDDVAMGNERVGCL